MSTNIKAENPEFSDISPELFKSFIQKPKFPFSELNFPPSSWS